MFQPKTKTTQSSVLKLRRLQTLLALGLLFHLACDSKLEAPPELKMTREARYILGNPTDITWPPIPTDAESSWAVSASQRRHLAWSLWSEFFRPVGQYQLPAWRLWYQNKDILRLYSYLRKHHHPVPGDYTYTEEAIDAAFSWHRSSLIEDGFWSEEQLADWFQHQNISGLPGTGRNYYNATFVRHFLINVQKYLDCFAMEASEGSLLSCQHVEVPVGSVILKSHWSRPALGVKVFEADELLEQLFGGDSFESSGQTTQASGAYQIQLATGSRFALTGIHMAVKWPKDWFWSSLFWLPQPQDEEPHHSYNTRAVLTDGALAGLESYGMCASAGFGLADNDHPPGGLRDWVASMHEEFSRPWCSNPYLEEGKNNHRTNCQGCHQHASSRLSAEALVGWVEHDVESLMKPIGAVDDPSAVEDRGSPLFFLFARDSALLLAMKEMNDAFPNND